MKKWQIVGLVWGFFMFLFLTFVLPYFNDEKITTTKILVAIPIWIIAGLVFGYSQRKNLQNKKE